VIPKAILMADPATVDLEADPIRPDWILSGAPEASSKILATSRDWISNLVVWECTAGRFNWHYTRDEILVVLSGEAAIVHESGEKRHFGPGDVVFFPAGTSCTWLVTERIRKVAVVRETLWWPLGICVKIWNKILWKLGGKGMLTPHPVERTPAGVSQHPEQ